MWIMFHLKSMPAITLKKIKSSDYNSSIDHIRISELQLRNPSISQRLFSGIFPAPNTQFAAKYFTPISERVLNPRLFARCLFLCGPRIPRCVYGSQTPDHAMWRVGEDEATGTNMTTKPSLGCEEAPPDTNHGIIVPSLFARPPFKLPQQIPAKCTSALLFDNARRHCQIRRYLLDNIWFISHKEPPI